ncbi:hypothetical protein [Rhizobium sp. CCGE531]|uniref:hypothetical protein n=1 Tax=Rhizobium sp. CCGE531 TaxID=2364271 RepID=UPI0013C444E7|nr:hypothetical protein [Rhizobium sp. CCGE531]
MIEWVLSITPSASKTARSSCTEPTLADTPGLGKRTNEALDVAETAYQAALKAGDVAGALRPHEIALSAFSHDIT